MGRAFFGPLAGLALALAAAACAPAAPPISGTEQEKMAAMMAAAAQTELGRRIGSGPEALVAGNRLNADPRRRFYARHEFAPVWTVRRDQADAVTEAIGHAGDHGLDPEMFRA